jgi:hypothetical protein
MVLVGAVSRRAAIASWAVVLPLLGMVVNVALVIVVAVGFFSIRHVGVLVDDRHHLPVINLHNRVTISEVPFVVVMKGLIGLLGDTAQISSGFGTRTGCLEVVDEGGAEVLPAVDGARAKSLCRRTV